jgi:hypothetical protein
MTDDPTEPHVAFGSESPVRYRMYGWWNTLLVYLTALFAVVGIVTVVSAIGDSSGWEIAFLAVWTALVAFALRMFVWGVASAVTVVGDTLTWSAPRRTRTARPGLELVAVAMAVVFVAPAATGGLPLARASTAVRPWATVVWAPTRILAGPHNDYEYFFYVSVTKCGGGATAVSVRFDDERYPSDTACPTGKPAWEPGSLEPIAAGRQYTATAWATQSGQHPRNGRVQRWRLQMPPASSIAWLGCGESCRLRST